MGHPVSRDVGDRVVGVDRAADQVADAAKLRARFWLNAWSVNVSVPCGPVRSGDSVLSGMVSEPFPAWCPLRVEGEQVHVDVRRTAVAPSQSGRGPEVCLRRPVFFLHFFFLAECAFFFLHFFFAATAVLPPDALAADPTVVAIASAPITTSTGIKSPLLLINPPAFA